MTDEFTEERGYEPRELQNPGIIEAFAAGVMAHGQEAVRKKLRKGPTTLYGEMNPNGDQKKAKLSVDDAIEATRVTRNVTWLSMLAEGYATGASLHMATEKPVGGKVVAPIFNEEERARGLTDFNDLHQSRGLDEVKKQVGLVLQQATDKSRDKGKTRELAL